MKRIILMLICITMLMGDIIQAGISGYSSLMYRTNRVTKDGSLNSDTDSLYQNYYFNFNRSITSNISYQLYIRANLQDSELTNSEGETSSTSLRVIEPSFDLSWRKRDYNLGIGYRRQEEWNTASLSNEERETTEFSYMRFNLTPYVFPSILIEINRQREFDYKKISELDKKNTTYSISSLYRLPSPDIRFSYYLNFTRTDQRTPLTQPEKIIGDNMAGNVELGYNKKFFNNRLYFIISYRGNYSRNKQKQYLTQTGNFLFKRTVGGGFYINSSDRQSALNSLSTLIDGNQSSSAGINLSTSSDNQIGILISEDKSVDRIYIYVNKDISSDTNLLTVANWIIYWSNVNQFGTWTQESVRAVSMTSVDTSDPLNPIYRYELRLQNSRTAKYFKVINLVQSSISNVEVTEIEAYGTDPYLEVETTTVTNSAMQELDLKSSYHIRENLTFIATYSLDRSDTNPDPLPLSIWDFLQNIADNSIEKDKSRFSSIVTRNYGLGMRWIPHSIIEVNTDVRRSESFDSSGNTDFRSDTYQTGLRSNPLPDFTTSLTLSRSNIYLFDERDSTVDSITLSLGMMLYEDVHMVNDLGYNHSKSYSTDITSSNYIVNSTIDASITKNTTGQINFSYNRAESGDDSSENRSAFVIITYRPGRFIDLSGNVRVTDSDGDQTYVEGITIGWRPLPVIQMNINYSHTDSDTDPTRADTASGTISWRLTKFATFDVTVNYSISEDTQKTENQSYSARLNCRF